MSNSNDDRLDFQPQLRFPQFRDSGDWNLERFGNKEFAKIFKGKGISKADIVKNGNTPCIRYGELYTHYGEVISSVLSYTNLPREELFLSKKNDVLIPSSGETKIDIATASCVTADDIALGGDLNVIRSKANGAFLSYYVNGTLKHEIAKVAQGDSVVHLYPTQLEKIKLLIPSPDEQQKIADCLLSLDELIDAEEQKLDAIRDFKRGLMQELFPAEGETVPKRRFAEFEDAPEWEEKPLAELIRSVVPPMKLQTKDYARDGKVPIIDQSPNLIAGWTDNGDAIIDAGIPLIIFGDHTCTLKLVNQPFAQGADGIKIFSGNSELNTVFLLYQLLANPLQMKEYRRHFSILKEKKIRYPKLHSGEQERIADCFSSLDETIASQAQKLDLLRAHKQGLMSCLFASINEVGHG